METNRCEDEILHFRTKYSKNYINKTTTKVKYANNILNNISRCSQLVLKLKGSLEKLRHMELETNEDTNLNQEMIFHEKKHLKLQNDSNDILEICRNLTAVTATRSQNPAAQIKIRYKEKTDPKLTYIDNVEAETNNVEMEGDHTEPKGTSEDGTHNDVIQCSPKRQNLKCKLCNWESGLIKLSKGKQRFKAHNFKHHSNKQDI